MKSLVRSRKAAQSGKVAHAETPELVAPQEPAAVEEAVVVDDSARAEPSPSPGLPSAQGLSASVEVLTLPPGLYLFSVRNAPPAPVGGSSGLSLPALLVGPGPGTPSSDVEILSAPRMGGNWLCHQGEALVARTSGDATSVLLTSLGMPGMTPLQITVQRLDMARGDAPAQIGADTQTPAAAPVTAAPPVPKPPAGPRQVPLQIVAHIQRRGDVPFVDTLWAGFIGGRLAVEGFSLSPLADIPPEQIEYKALNVSGDETPWSAGGVMCGSRGKGLPLVGFCVRLRPQPGGKRYDCEYSAAFISGRVIGPVKNGAPCWSSDQRDFIEAIQVKIVERKPSAG